MRTSCCTEMFDPIDKDTFQSGREELLSCMSLMVWFMDIKKASTKSGIRNLEIDCHFLDVDFAAILLLEYESTTALLEKFFSFDSDMMVS